MRRGVYPPWERGRTVRRGTYHHGRKGGLCAEVPTTIPREAVCASLYTHHIHREAVCASLYNTLIHREAVCASLSIFPHTQGGMYAPRCPSLLHTQGGMYAPLCPSPSGW